MEKKNGKRLFRIYLLLRVHDLDLGFSTKAFNKARSYQPLALLELTRGGGGEGSLEEPIPGGATMFQ